jgi:hypothetical protein
MHSFCNQSYPNTDDSTDNPPPKVVQGYKVGLIYTSTPHTLTGFSSTYFIRTSLTNRRLRHTKSSKRQETMKPYFSTSVLARLTKTLLFESLIENGSSHTNGGYLILHNRTTILNLVIADSGAASIVDVYLCGSTTVVMSVKSLPPLNTSIDSLTVLPQMIDLSCFTHRGRWPLSLLFPISRLR